MPSLEFDADVRRAVEDYLRPDAERLRALTGLELAHWSVWRSG